jgi:spore photoproduct lyase
VKIIKQKTKTLTTRDNGRSADAISPNFIYGCLGGCMKSYCYVGRFNNDRVYVNENINDILHSIIKWSEGKPWPKIPNQTDEKYYTIDIGCSTDVALMSKHYDWQKVFDFFNSYNALKSTFATKYPTMFDPKKYVFQPGKHRIRVSLMPQKYSDVLEPNTDKIIDRINSIPRLQEYMEVHINFSPIIYTDGWLDEYKELFKELAHMGIDVPCECIFLTYNETSHKNASDEVNALCWNPEIQEAKDSQYAPDNIRYKHQLKIKMVKDFVSLYSEYFNPKNIRYIF